MPTRLALLAAAATALLVAPAAAAAATPEPLVDRQPATTELEDRVLTGAAPRARASAAQAGETLEVPVGDGTAVSVRFSAGFAPDLAVAESYVRFLAGLPHGAELDRLGIRIAPAADVGELCGGGADVLACYRPSAQEMTVPGEELGTLGGPSTSYVVAHEYGHHVAANRDNAPFSAIDYGPKHWASEERVCARVIEERLAPGDEGEAYRDNPGESWAEVYARLTYPELPWTFSELLAPDAASYAAARRDVLEPWTGPRTRTFTLPAGRRAQSFRLPLRLDGSLRARVVGRPGSDVALTVLSGDEREGRSRGRGARHTVDFEVACRERALERLRFAVRRRAGSGPVELRVTYAG